MAKRLFLCDDITYSINNRNFQISIFRNLVRLGSIDQSDFIDLFSMRSNKLGWSIVFIDITQQAGDFLQSQSGVIELPLSALDNDASVLNGNPLVDAIETRLGYSLRSNNRVRDKIFQLIGYVEFDNATSMD